MRQRNDTGSKWTFAATPATDDTPEQPPYTVGPGEIGEHPQLLHGWTAVDDAEAEHDKAADEPPTKTARKRTEDKGGEPR